MIVVAVVLVFLHTETAKMPEKQQFQEDWEKVFGSGLADRVGRVIRNTDIFFLALIMKL